MKESEEEKTARLDKRSDEVKHTLIEIAAKAGVRQLDIYNAVFVQYKTDNALREEANKNMQLRVQEGRIKLAGKQFLIDDYSATHRWNQIYRKQQRIKKIKKFFGIKTQEVEITI